MSEESGTRSLEGKVALLTGAVRRNGRAAALALARDGAAIVLNCRKSVEEGNSLVREIAAIGGSAILYKADITDESQVKEMFDHAVGEFGSIDILVNNAADRSNTPFLDMTFDEWKHYTRIVMDGAFLCSRAALPHMVKAGWGSIVNMGGISTYVGAPGRAHISFAKAGLAGFTRTLAKEFASQGIRVNCISPGMIGGPRPASAGVVASHRADKIPVGREGYSEEIGEAIRWLCQPSQGFITGQTIHVNGGEYLP